jgi:hypothetical protein
MPRWDLEWEHWGHADHDLRNYQREEVSIKGVLDPAYDVQYRCYHRANPRYSNLYFPYITSELTRIGGLLADPVGSYPSIFGPGSPLGGKDGVHWMTKYPYALPNLISAIFLLSSCLAVLFFLEETSEFSKYQPDYPLAIGRWIIVHIFHRSSTHGYSTLPTQDFSSESTHDVELQQTPTSARLSTSQDKPAYRRTLPFRKLWTPNLVTTMLSHALLAMHVGTFHSLWFIFLSTPRFDPLHRSPPSFHPHGIHFTGGLALPPPRIGLALAILGVIGITLQLLVYPRLSHRLGAAKSYRIFLLLFPVTYALAPFLSIVPSWSKPPEGVTGPLIWVCITIVLFIQVLARTFALPCTAILVNNCCPHPSVLGTVHGLGQSVSSLTRTFGPVMGGWIFGRGLDMGIVGLAWWILGCVAVVGVIVAQGVREGDGHEVLLEGEVRMSDGRVKRLD